jgi:hypothetical protein
MRHPRRQNFRGLRQRSLRYERGSRPPLDPRRGVPDSGNARDGRSLARTPDAACR